MANTNSPPPPAESRRHRLRRRLRRAIFTISIVLLAFLGVALMLPVWANTEQGRAYVLERINHRLTGSLSVAKWRLGWFHGIQMQGIVLASKDGTPVLQCASLQTDLTLWSWLRGSYDLGNTVLNSPRLVASRYPDGSNDLSRIFDSPNPASANRPSYYFSSLRGSIHIDNGQAILRSTASPREIHILNATAEIPIASPTSPIHLTIHSPSTNGSTALTIEGTLPPMAKWAHRPADIVSDLDISAANLPVAPLADWLGLSPAWEQSLGSSIDTLSFANHKLATDPISTPAFHLHSQTGDIDIKCILAANGQHITLTLPDTPDTRDLEAHATLILGRPVLDCLAYVNPVLAHALPRKGAADLTLNAAKIDLAQPANASASGLLTLTGIELQPTGLVSQIYSLARARPEGPATAPASTWPARIPPTRITLADARLACDSLSISVPTQPRILFSGSIGLDRSLQLLLTVPLFPANTPDSLGTGTVQIPIRGTIDDPVLDKRPLIDLH